MRERRGERQTDRDRDRHTTDRDRNRFRQTDGPASRDSQRQTVTSRHTELMRDRQRQ